LDALVEVGELACEAGALLGVLVWQAAEQCGVLLSERAEPLGAEDAGVEEAFGPLPVWALTGD
jgi:hypothetical protein